MTAGVNWIIGNMVNN